MTAPALPEADVIRRIELQTTHELEMIPGVLAAALWLHDLRQVREAYITGAHDAPLEAIRTSVSQVLRRNGLIFSPDVVHVATLEPRDATPRRRAGRALLLDAVEVNRADHHVTCRVRLTRAGKPFSGAATDMDSEAGHARAAARATLAAAERSTPDVRLGVEGIQILDLFGRRYVILSVEAAHARRVSHLAGINAVERSIESAACLATLGAIERWLSR